MSLEQVAADFGVDFEGAIAGPAGTPVVTVYPIDFVGCPGFGNAMAFQQAQDSARCALFIARLWSQVQLDHPLAGGRARRSREKSIAAAVDRLLHHAHLVATEGPSVRLEEAMAGAGVVALSSS